MTPIHSVQELRQALATRQKEKDFLAEVIQTASLNGWLVHHDRPARRLEGWSTPLQGHPGFPDLVLARWPQLVIAEIKTQRGRLSTTQNDWLRELGLATTTEVTVCVWRPEDKAEILAVLSRFSPRVLP